MIAQIKAMDLPIGGQSARDAAPITLRAEQAMQYDQGRTGSGDLSG
jgi:hypothetical protein